jgi:hypothetical protein
MPVSVELFFMEIQVSPNRQATIYTGRKMTLNDILNLYKEKRAILD